MYLELTEKQFRRMLDMCYIGNWVLNSIRGEDRFEDYDALESHLFACAKAAGFSALTEMSDGVAVPSRAFVEGGIHDAIMDYEDTVFFEILAEELARRDLALEGLSDGDAEQLNARIRDYIAEFEMNGTDNLSVSPGGS
ncbi:MAG: hypothetical protein LBR85_05725 [Oscillospiraceae bacterium]|jgi:hypothetical protein|nr:hypothetical protein [Oscillospiraceae bacterium]